MSISSRLLLSKQTTIFKNPFKPTNHGSRLSVFTDVQKTPKVAEKRFKKATFPSEKPLKSFFHNVLTCFANRNDFFYTQRMSKILWENF
jgi:hypothetical protein